MRRQKRQPVETTKTVQSSTPQEATAMLIYATDTIPSLKRSDTIEIQDAATPSERIRLRDEQHEVTVLKVYSVPSSMIQPRNSLMFAKPEANLRARLQRTIRASRERVQAMQRQDPMTFTKACSIRPVVVRFCGEPEGAYNVRSSR